MWEVGKQNYDHLLLSSSYEARDWCFVLKFPPCAIKTFIETNTTLVIQYPYDDCEGHINHVPTEPASDLKQANVTSIIAGHEKSLEGVGSVWCRSIPVSVQEIKYLGFDQRLSLKVDGNRGLT